MAPRVAVVALALAASGLRAQGQCPPNSESPKDLAFFADSSSAGAGGGQLVMCQGNGCSDGSAFPSRGELCAEVLGSRAWRLVLASTDKDCYGDLGSTLVVLDDGEVLAQSGSGETTSVGKCQVNQGLKRAALDKRVCQCGVRQGNVGVEEVGSTFPSEFVSLRAAELVPGGRGFAPMLLGFFGGLAFSVLGTLGALSVARARSAGPREYAQVGDVELPDFTVDSDEGSAERARLIF